MPPLFLFVVPILKVFWPDFVKSDRLGWFNFFLFLRLIFWGRSEGLLFSSFTHARNDWGSLRFNFLFLWLWLEYIVVENVAKKFFLSRRHFSGRNII